MRAIAGAIIVFIGVVTLICAATLSFHIFTQLLPSNNPAANYALAWPSNLTTPTIVALVGFALIVAGLVAVFTTRSPHT